MSNEVGKTKTGGVQNQRETQEIKRDPKGKNSQKLHRENTMRKNKVSYEKTYEKQIKP